MNEIVTIKVESLSLMVRFESLISAASATL